MSEAPPDFKALAVAFLSEWNRDVHYTSDLGEHTRRKLVLIEKFFRGHFSQPAPSSDKEMVGAALEMAVIRLIKGGVHHTGRLEMAVDLPADLIALIRRDAVGIEDDQVTDSCGCVYCDLKVPLRGSEKAAYHVVKNFNVACTKG